MTSEPDAESSRSLNQNAVPCHRSACAGWKGRVERPALAMMALMIAS